MRDYAAYFNDRKKPEKRGVSINRDIDWWMEYLAGKMAKLLFLVLLAVLFLTIKSFWQVGKSHQAFPVQNITLNGNVVITRPKDIEKVLEKFSDKSFFTLSVQELANEITNLPWIEKADVTRLWSNGLIVDLQERKAVYRWGKDELVDASGNRFDNVDKELFANLPLLNGKDGHESEVIFAYEQLMDKLGDRAEKLEIASFDLNKYLSWELHLQSGMVIKFGRDNYQQRLSRFVDAYQLGKIPKFDQLDGVDFRYRQGFSVKWKPEFSPKSMKALMLKASENI